MDDSTDETDEYEDGYAVVSMRARDGTKRRVLDGKVYRDRDAAEERADEAAENMSRGSNLTVTIQHRKIV